MKENIIVERKLNEHVQRQESQGTLIERVLGATEFEICCSFQYYNCEYLIAP